MFSFEYVRAELITWRKIILKIEYIQKNLKMFASENAHQYYLFNI